MERPVPPNPIWWTSHSLILQFPREFSKFFKCQNWFEARNKLDTTDVSHLVEVVPSEQLLLEILEHLEDTPKEKEVAVNMHRSFWEDRRLVYNFAQGKPLHFCLVGKGERPGVDVLWKKVEEDHAL